MRDSFPECPPSSGPTGFSLYWDDERYEQLLERESGWRALVNGFHSQEFIEWGVRQFGDVAAREGCTIDLAKARYVSYREDRIDKERSALRRVEHAPEELWVRVDIHQGRVGYGRMRHRDHARRFVSMLVYLCDGDEAGLEGGSLQLHGPRWKPWQRATTITPRHNLMVAFPCSDRSAHSVDAITAQRQPRNYLQIHISSSVDIWPRSRWA